jgi:hypothetical protein
MACNCADEIDEILKTENAALNRGWVMNDTTKNNPRLIIDTVQIETGRGKPQAPKLFINYCPFCGVEYDPTPADGAMSSTLSNQPQHGIVAE